MGKLEKKSIKQTYGKLIARGFQALVIKDAAVTTVQPLTRRGYEAIYRMAAEAGAPEHILDGLNHKSYGHYDAAAPVQNTPEQIVRTLVMEQGLPDGSVAVFEAGVELPQLLLGEAMH